MRVLAISVDTPEVSRKFAAEYKLDFPLIEDEALKLASQYVGVDQNGFSLPGIVIVAPDQTVAVRQVGETPGDRIYAAELLRIVDGISEKYGIAKAGPAGKPGAAGGYAPLERVNVRLGINLGVAQERAVQNDFGFAMDAALAGLYPLGRHVMLGALVRGLTGSSTRTDIAAALRVRLPGADDNGELYAQIPFGLTLDVLNDAADDHARTGWHSGLALGLQFAPKPSFAFFFELESLIHRFTGRAPLDQRIELRLQAGGGVSFLF